MSTPASEKKVYNKTCICDWGDLCKDAFDLFNNKLEDSHPWKGSLITCTPSVSGIKSLAFAKCLYYIYNKGEVKIGKKIFIGRHHFSQHLLLKHPGNRSNFLYLSEVRDLDKDENFFHGGYAVRKFSLYSLLNTKKEDDKSLFIAAPLVPKADIIQEISIFSSKRSSTTIVDSYTTPTKKLKLKVMSLQSLNNSSMITTKHEMHELERKNKFVYKPINCIYKDLVEIFNSSIDIEEFSSHEYVMRAMNDLAFQARRNALCPCMFELAEGKILHVCINPRIDDCLRFKILARASGRTYCDKCNEDLRAINRRQERKELGFGKRIESSSHDTFVPRIHSKKIC